VPVLFAMIEDIAQRTGQRRQAVGRHRLEEPAVANDVLNGQFA
jgi:hypothetical protein